MTDCHGPLYRKCGIGCVPGCRTGAELGENFERTLVPATKKEEKGKMNENDTSGGPIPFMQQLLDSPLLLLTIGVVTPTVLYIIWGVMEVIAIPLAP